MPIGHLVKFWNHAFQSLDMKSAFLRYIFEAAYDYFFKKPKFKGK